MHCAGNKFWMAGSWTSAGSGRSRITDPKTGFGAWFLKKTWGVQVLLYICITSQKCVDDTGRGALGGTRHDEIAPSEEAYHLIWHII